MPAEGILVIVSVCAGKEECLRLRLNAFGNDIQGKQVTEATGGVRIEFQDSNSIHFAQLVLLDDPDRGPNRQRLLLATDFDGTLEAHAKEILRLSRQPDALWGCCEGYAGPADFAGFLGRHTVTPGAHYIAFRGDNLGELRANIDFQAWFQKCLAEPKAAQIFWALPDLLRLGAALRKLVDALLWPWEAVRGVVLVVLEFVRLSRRLGTAEVYFAGLQITKTLGRIGVIRFFNRLLGNFPDPAPHPFSAAEVSVPASPVPRGYPPENVVQQNQLTLVTEVHPDRLQRLKAVLGLVDFVARKLSPPGSLAGISTIHTVRWALLDEGRRFLMVSNYDGTWENYIDEFAEMILSGLDALWRSAPDYPRAGAQDVAALKEFLRAHQVPANVFYSAYEDTTVLNLIDDREFAWWFGRAVRWMAGSHPGCPSPPPWPPAGGAETKPAPACTVPFQP